MKITFESSPTRFGFPFRIIGNAGRYDTISDCEFLDDSHIVCVDRQEAKLYLIQFDLSGSTYTILDSQTVVCIGEPQHFEIISIRRPETAGAPATLYSISYKNTLFSCQIKNNKFCNFQTQIINSDDAYHGVQAVGANLVYVTNMIRPTITELNTKTGGKRTINCCRGTRMKDMAILDDDHLIAISSDRGPVSGKQNADGSVTPRNPPYDSHVLIYNRHTGGEPLAKHVLPATQIDGCIYHAPHCYVTCTDVGGTGYIFRSKIDGYNFTEITEIPCAAFPHGLSIHGDKFTYTSYSESAVFIDPLTRFTS
jgi:hypothetical protein